MRSDTPHRGWAEICRRWISQPNIFAIAFTTFTAMLLLVTGSSAILSLQSFKYLGALIFIGMAGAAFLALPRKFNFLLFMTGFSVPFYLECILLSRDTAGLSVAGTTLLIIATGVIGLVTSEIPSKEIRFKPTILVPAILFIMSGLLSLLNTTDRTMTLIASVRTLEMPMLFWVLYNVVRDEERLLIFLRGLYLGFAIECVIYVIQNILGVSFDILGNTRLVGATDLEEGNIGSQRGTFGVAPATAALYFSVFSLTLMGVFLSRRKLPIRLKPTLGMIMGVGCLVLSAKRAPLGGFALGILVIAWLVVTRAPMSLPRLARVLGAIAIPVLIALPVLWLRAQANHEEALEERLNLTKVAWNMHDAHPLLGVGYGTYDSVKRDYLPPNWKGWLFKVHNRYLLVLAETGFVGLGTLLLLYLMILREAYLGIERIAAAYRPYQIAFVAALVAIYWEMLWDIFDSRQQDYILWSVASLAIILPRALAETPTREAA